jgi:hypothetical protein
VSLDLAHLDSHTRQFMLEEFEADLADGSLYCSPHLNEAGLANYPDLLRDAVLTGTEASLAEALYTGDTVRQPIRRQHLKELGPGEALADVTTNLAEREFHRFYIRGLCRRALDQGVSTLVIYRARPPDPGRAPSNTMVGVRIVVSSLLEDLRGTFRSLPPHGLPQCRDPGLSVRFPDDYRLREDDAQLATPSAAR